MKTETRPPWSYVAEDEFKRCHMCGVSRFVKDIRVFKSEESEISVCVDETLCAKWRKAGV